MTAAERPLIAAFDVATNTGVCDGVAGGIPRLWTWVLSDAGDGRPRRLAYLRAYLDSYFKENAVGRVFYEKPMPIAAQVNAKPGSGFGASEDQLAFLRGSLGVLEACAAMAGIHVIEGVSVQDARKHFCGQRTFARGADGKSQAKDAVLRMCAILKIPAANDHEADAAAIWSYGCAISNPRTAHLHSPLFQARR
jgi:hypothetical protein